MAIVGTWSYRPSQQHANMKWNDYSYLSNKDATKGICYGGVHTDEVKFDSNLRHTLDFDGQLLLELLQIPEMLFLWIMPRKICA
jgi:hypothetical protein